MLQTIVRVCQIAFFALGVVALGWWLSGKIGGERRRDLTPFERLLAERAVENVVHELPRREVVKRLLVLPVGGQELDGRITDLLIAKLEQDRDEYDVIDARRYDGVLTPGDPREALSALRKLKKDARPDGVLYANVAREFGHGGVGATVSFEAQILDPKADGFSAPVRDVERIDSRASLDWFSPFMQQASKFWRLAIWVVLTAGLPFALFPLVQAITRRENNTWNVALVGGFTALDMALAAVLLGLRLGFFSCLLVLLAGLGGFVYDVLVCDQIDEMRR